MKPTVTQLLNLLNKPALMKWANKIGLEGIRLEDYRKKIASSGVAIHNQIENYIKYQTPFKNKEHQFCFDTLFENKKIISVEKKIENEWFLGRLDIEFEMNGEVYVADFKRNAIIYLENKLQLAAYRMGTNSNTAIIQVPEMIMKEVVFDYEKAENILKHLSQIYQLRNEL